LEISRGALFNGTISFSIHQFQRENFSQKTSVLKELTSQKIPPPTLYLITNKTPVSGFKNTCVFGSTPGLQYPQNCFRGKMENDACWSGKWFNSSIFIKITSHYGATVKM
jgi:hypothetical protein